MMMIFLRWLRQRFSLAHDLSDPAQIQADVESSLEFGTANLWVLVFAILVASVGLNVNSTAVVIGAMLISPIMGPIVGVGYGAATMDLGMIRRGLQSLLTTAVIGLLVSAAYFFLTPLTDAGTELTGRTAPTTWDVLIALFGGAAGAVGLTRRERGNVIPGVAIATALMPPLCTAGYGLATAQWDYLLGAAYLFCINSVYISLATFLVIRILPLPRYSFVSAQRARRVRIGIWAVALLTAVPSVYLAADIVQRTTFDHNAQRFISEQLQRVGSSVITRRLDADARTINVLLAGRQLAPARLDSIRAQLPRYQLRGTQLTVRQGIAQLDSADVGAFRSSLLADASQRNQQALASYDTRLRQLLRSAADSMEAVRPAPATALPPAPALLREVQVWNSAVRQLTLTQLVQPALDSLAADTVLVVRLRSQTPLPAPERQRLAKWLRLRTGGRWPVQVLPQT